MCLYNNSILLADKSTEGVSTPVQALAKRKVKELSTMSAEFQFRL
jgi:hypothetical protein